MIFLNFLLENQSDYLYNLTDEQYSKLFKNSSNVAKGLNLNLSKRPEELSCEAFYKIALKYENS